MIQEPISYCLFFLWQEKELAKSEDLFWHIPGGIAIAQVLGGNAYCCIFLECPFPRVCTWLIPSFHFLFQCHLIREAFPELI